MQRSACAMHVIPMITFKSKSNYACALIYTDIHTDTSDNIIYHIPFNGKY